MSDSNDDGARLADTIVSWAEADSNLPEAAKFVVLAALDGEESLMVALNGAGHRSAHRERLEPKDFADVRPVGAYIKSIAVQGFRGIGPTAKLEVRPAPGLTVVAGRNGSGKSSFSDALEVALTGNTYRWRKKKALSEHWRNVHDGTPCEVRVELAEEGTGITTVGVDWPDGAALADQKAWVQRPGKRREPGVTSLGWDRAIELYQPTLSYDELGGVLDQGPSKLFDKIDAILGIEQATDGQRRLAAALKQLQEADKAAKAQVRELKKTFAALSDERATRALEQLRRRSPDLDIVEAIATGTTREPVSELDQLRSLTQHMLPPRSDVTAAARALRTAAKESAEIEAFTVDMVGRRASLLREVLTYHDHYGDGRCPVCGDGVIDAAWRTRVTTELGGDDELIERHRRAIERIKSARSRASTLLGMVPVPVQPDRVMLDSITDAVSAYERWRNSPGADEELADHLETTFDELDAAFALVRQEAEGALVQRQDEWAVHATALAAWVGIARKARETEPEVLLAGVAHSFMMSVVERLREEKLARLTDTAREIWAALKQESNVNLGKIELKGTNTRRHVELRADVDGAEAQALGVMSQGELHALALALFLPRATMRDSPFRFVVLDDPIQAMDPAKVDGFVRVLARLAVDRQVLVFSHDDRLTQIIRQTGVSAEILEVHRHAGSSVEVVRCLDPASRYVDDGFAVLRDKEVSVEIAARIIPGLCRMAVEAAVHEVYLTHRFVAGDRRTDVEADWQSLKKTRHRIALIIHGDPKADLTRWLDAKPWRHSALRVVTSSVHTGVDPRRLPDALRATERLIADLRTGG